MLGGLLSFLPKLDEHQKRALWRAAAEGMQARGNAGQQIGAMIGGGLLGYDASRGLADRRAEEAQQREARQMAIDQQKQAQASRAGMQSAFQQAFAPPQAAPNDPYGEHMTPGGGGMQEFLKLAGPHMDPMQAVSMMQKEKPRLHAVGGALVGDDGKVVYQTPDKPDYKVGQTREIKSGQRVFTQEYNGKEWKTIGESPLFKPEGPERPDKPPQGYRYTADRSGLEPIPGGPADAKVGKEAEAQRRREEGALARADQVLAAVRQSVDQTGVMSAGPIGQLTRNIGGTPAFNLAKKVDEIKANIGFAELQAMREASPTGGALGQVAIQELQMLQSVLGSLDTAQSPDQLLGALYKVEKHYNNWKQTVKRARESQGGPKPGHVEDGYEYVGGPPGSPSSWRRK